MPSLARFGFLAALTALTLGAAPLAAQITLPPKPPQGDLAPHHLCSVCGARNTMVPGTATRNEQGLPVVYCAACKKETAHRPNAADPGLGAGTGGARPSDNRLRLPPAQPKAAPQPAAPAARPSAEPAASPGAPTPTLGAAPLAEDPAQFIFDALGKVKSLDDPLVPTALESLARLGEVGRARALRELNSPDDRRFHVAWKLLMQGTTPAELDALYVRAAEKLPPSQAAAFLDALLALDPVRASPAVLAALLDHPTPAARTLAERQLRAQLAPELVPLLAPRAESKRAETRGLALGLLADIDDPRATDALFAHLADPRCSVAQSVLRALAGSKDKAIEARLFTTAFDGRWILREHAYALLALVEREEQDLAPLFDERHVEPLLKGMSSNDVFVSGACAAALAGVGFRSSAPRQTLWLDRDVVDRLVYALSGKVFHDDLAALTRAATARLVLLTGQDIGADGPRWVEWWREARASFFARRAYMAIEPGDEAALSLRCGRLGSEFVLLGPLAPAPSASDGAAREVCYLTEGEARELVALLAEQGVFGPERLPGQRGARGQGSRTLDLVVAGRGKSFTLGQEVQEEWFTRVLDAAGALRDKNRWQRYVPPGRTQHAFWQGESNWWAAPQTALARDLRLKSYVLAALIGRRSSERDDGLDELSRLALQPGLITSADFDPLHALLEDEPAWGERAQRLARLTLRAAADTSIAAAGDAASVTARKRRLVVTIDERFGADARPDLAEALRSADPAVLRTLATDTRPGLRAASALALAHSADAADHARVIKLMEDRHPAVEVAAIEAAGAARLEVARTELVVRARLGLPAARAAALLAIGKLRGEFVLDALLLGASDTDPAIRSAAASGMAELADAASVPIFVSMLSEGPESLAFGPARAGLLKLGQQAWPELLRAVHKTGHPARREAALILSEQGSAEPATALFQILATNPTDTRVAEELCVLTGLDARGSADPVSAWWSWYDGVTHDDALLWFLAALQRAGVTPVAPETLRGAGTRAGKLFLVDVLERQEPFLVERARRELARLVGRELVLPARGPQRDAWVAAQREAILAQRDP